MALFGFLKKKGVPGELPDLAMDEIEDRLKDADSFKNQQGAAANGQAQKQGAIPQPPTSQDKSKSDSKDKVPAVPPSGDASQSQIPSGGSGDNESMSEEDQDAEEIKKALDESNTGDTNNKSFFDELQKNISEEIADPDKIGDWYENKFASKDILAEMRNYWERKKINSMMQVLGKNFKERINEKTGKLQDLEKEWQEIYFQLIEKEEEIREEEAELKEDLSEFVELCRKRKKSISHNGQRKTKEKAAGKR